METAEHPTAISIEVDQLAHRARSLRRSGCRVLIGIVGAPGAGKSTLCSELAAQLGEEAVLLGMDGFHLANAELLRLGRRGRKGAPDTFDTDGYVALLRRLRAEPDATIYGPTFDRSLEESIGSAVAIASHTPIVITEGNYLLLESGGWGAVADCLDEVWFVDVAPEVRSLRLVERRLGFGDSGDEALGWVERVDMANAELVDQTDGRADQVIHLTTDRDGVQHAVLTPNPKEQSR